ncbi:MAG: hypothetical protein ACI87E_004940 [Mariniblastus sp.]|jgi:hypothetical protein
MEESILPFLSDRTPEDEGLSILEGKEVEVFSVRRKLLPKTFSPSHHQGQQIFTGLKSTHSGCCVFTCSLLAREIASRLTFPSPNSG